MTIPAESHPGHVLLTLPSLPPAEALNAWRAQLIADLNSRRTDGVLIHGGFIGSDLQDHGIESILEILSLAFASSIDWSFSDNNYDERTRPIGEVLAEQIEDIQSFLTGQLESRLREKYLPVLIEWEEARRRQEADEAE